MTMYNITNTESTARVVYGTRIEPGETERLDIDEEQVDELSNIHFDIDEVGTDADADEDDVEVEREEDHECDVCGRSFESERGLKTHARQSHEGDD